MHARQRWSSRRERRNRLGQKVVDGLTIGAEASNVGILVQVLGGWFPAFAAFVAVTPLAYFMLIGDPAIYFLRALIRLTKLVGKKVFKIQFEEERHGKPHPWNTAGTLFSLACFVLAIALFCGALIAPPVGITLAWTVGLLGQSCIGFFEYIWPEKQAYKKFQSLEQDSEATPEMKEAAKQAWLEAKKSKELFMKLLLGLSVLLICGSAAVFAPPLLAVVLAIASKAASVGLGYVACSRFYHWCKFKWRHRNDGVPTEKPVSEIELMPPPPRVGLHRVPSPAPAPAPSGLGLTLVASSAAPTVPTTLRSQPPSPSRGGLFAVVAEQSSYLPLALLREETTRLDLTATVPVLTT